MIRNEIEQIAVVQAETAQEFQKQFNETMSRLSDCNPQVQFNFNKGHCAYITYTQEMRIPDCVADEYHEQGIFFKCKQCPLHEVETDGRVKRVQCKYADLGFTHLDRECCEVFYRRLNLGEIEAKGDPYEYGAGTYWKRKKEFKERNRRYEDERRCI